jgi:hypothetical protein
MNRMRRILLGVIIASALGSCSSTLLERKLKQNSELNYSHLPALKKIVKVVGDNLEKSDHLIFILHPINRMPMLFNQDYVALIYDYRTKQTFYFRNDNIRGVTLQRTQYEPDFYLPINSTLKYYLNGQVGMLLKSQNPGMSDGGFGLTLIFDIDVNNYDSKRTTLNSVLFTKHGKITNSLSEAF